MTSTALPGLDVYSDSDSDDTATAPEQGTLSVDDSDDTATAPEQGTLSVDDGATKRRLPPLGSLSGTEAGSSKKPVQGNWPCYCFAEITVTDRLHALIDQANTLARETLPPTHSFQETSRSTVLHISLTRPIIVRAYERDDFIAEASAVVHQRRDSHPPFSVAFSRFAHLQNDEATRDFLVFEVGTGRDNLHSLSTALSTRLHRAFRAQPYYEEARFHVSTGFIEINNTHASLATAVTQLEAQLGDVLRSGPPIPVHRLGVQIGTAITYIDL